MSVLSSPAYQYLLHYKLSIPKFLPASISPMSARSLQKNLSSIWNSLSPTGSSASTRNSINNYRVSHGFTCLCCHCKYLHGICWILSHSPISNINQMVAQVYWWCLQCHQERWSYQISRAPQFHRSTHHIHHRTPRNRWTSLPRYPTKPTPIFIESTVYRKPTHADRYLDYSSNHLISAKLSVIHTLIHRAKQVCSKLEFLAKKWITFTKSYKTTTTQHSSFNKANPNRKWTKGQKHPQESL